MQRKSEQQLIALLDECRIKGVLPNGQKLSKLNFKYWLATQEYYGNNGQRLVGGQRLYGKWFSGEYIRNSRTAKPTPHVTPQVTPHVHDSRTSKYNEHTAVKHNNGTVYNKTGGNVIDPSKTPQVTPQVTPQDIDPRINFLQDPDFDFDFPKGESEKLPDYEWPSGDSEILVLQDLHFPFHDLEALKIAIKDGLDRRVSGVLINGDLVDFYNASFHDKDLDKMRIVDEIHLARQFFHLLRKAFPLAHIVFHEGNHETRLERYVIRNAPALKGIEAIEIKQLFHLSDHNIHFVKNKQIIKIGKLGVIHGNEFNTGGGGVHVARQIRLKAGASIAFGNFHRTQEDSGKDMYGNIHTAFSIGCLCDLNPLYMQHNMWNLGYGIIKLHADGTFIVHNKKIINGKAY